MKTIFSLLLGVGWIFSCQITGALDFPTYPGIADTLIYVDGERETVRIINTTPYRIFYSHPEAGGIYEVDRDRIARIIYGNGRIEILNRPVYAVIPREEWHHISLTEDPSEVEDLYEREPLEAMVFADPGKNVAIRNAKIELKRQAALLGADKVLVTGTEFREVNGYHSLTMTGIAYGLLPYEEIIE